MTASTPLPPRPTAGPPDPKKQANTMVTIFIFVFAMFVLFDQGLRHFLGELAGYLLQPTVGLNNNFPVVTLFLAGVVMVGITTIVRHFFTDYIGQAESQKIVSSFNKEFRQARIENNKYKIKKLTEQQQGIMKKSMDMSTTQMKLMPLTMIIVIPVFAWLDVFMGNFDPSPLVHLPWASGVNLNGTTLLPNWVLLYSLISIPFGQVLMRALRYIEFRKRLKEINSGLNGTKAEKA